MFHENESEKWEMRFPLRTQMQNFAVRWGARFVSDHVMILSAVGESPFTEVGKYLIKILYDRKHDFLLNLGARGFSEIAGKHC